MSTFELTATLFLPFSNISPVKSGLLFNFPTFLSLQVYKFEKFGHKKPLEIEVNH